MSDASAATELVLHQGGCHCGQVRWEIDAPAVLHTHSCNCSICNLTHYQHLIVPKERFRLVQGEEQLKRYTFGSGIAQHYFVVTAASSLSMCHGPTRRAACMPAVSIPQP